MAIARKSLKEIKAGKPKFSAARFDATSEKDIRRHMIEDGEDPGYAVRAEDIHTPQIIRKRLGMTQEQFARALRIPLATLRNWEQGRNAIDPAARSLLIVLAHDPKRVLATLESAA
ncbi:MAG TPA: helix-turn-helix domain-containing protein [Rhizomicrobium sp.]|nr:helix-turn-helix domain-containing protein [Rhizomicrobium sp.]